MGTVLKRVQRTRTTSGLKTRGTPPTCGEKAGQAPAPLFTVADCCRLCRATSERDTVGKWADGERFDPWQRLVLG